MPPRRTGCCWSSAATGPPSARPAASSRHRRDPRTRRAASSRRAPGRPSNERQISVTLPNSVGVGLNSGLRSDMSSTRRFTAGSRCMGVLSVPMSKGASSGPRKRWQFSCGCLGERLVSSRTRFGHSWSSCCIASRVSKSLSLPSITARERRRPIPRASRDSSSPVRASGMWPVAWSARSSRNSVHSRSTVTGSADCT